MEHQHFCPDQHTFTLPTVSSTTLRKHKEVTANVVKALQPLKDKIKECPENVTTFLPEKNQEILEDLKAFFLQASDEEDNWVTYMKIFHMLNELMLKLHGFIASMIEIQNVLTSLTSRSGKNKRKSFGSKERINIFFTVRFDGL